MIRTLPGNRLIRPYSKHKSEQWSEIYHADTGRIRPIPNTGLIRPIALVWSSPWHWSDQTYSTGLFRPIALACSGLWHWSNQANSTGLIRSIAMVWSTCIRHYKVYSRHRPEQTCIRPLMFITGLNQTCIRPTLSSYRHNVSKDEPGLGQIGPNKHLRNQGRLYTV